MGFIIKLFALKLILVLVLAFGYGCDTVYRKPSAQLQDVGRIIFNHQQTTSDSHVWSLSSIVEKIHKMECYCNCGW